MLLIDQNEARNHPDLVSLLQEQIEIDIANINQNPGSDLIYPDFVVFGASKLVGINRKTAGEWLSNPDKCIEQLQREIAGPVEHLVLLIEGVMVAGKTGLGTYVPNWGSFTPLMTRNGPHPSIGTVQTTRRAYTVNPKHAQNEQTRLEFMGVQVVHTYSLEDTVSKLVAFHELVMKDQPNTVLSRLIKPDVHATGLTMKEVQFAKQLMTCGANWGEELSTTTASLGLASVGDLFRLWDSGGELRDTMVREKAGVRTRRIGDAAENRLKTALGYTTPEQSRQGNQESLLSNA